MDSDTKIVAQSKIQLAEAYQVSLKTFKHWIQPIKGELGEYRGKTFTPKQVQIIYDLLGRP
ncbi:hypothetical protein [Carboxylicivirga sp. N1Y90]|uniref:hypothetical protein n=1 Tax=Carboxylicivirga fragile TaxID=3417571 RepID=UPI003D341731|nr:hypothetical protein [Marinilabiliaceae bacterium N1Y90]